MSDTTLQLNWATPQSIWATPQSTLIPVEGFQINFPHPMPNRWWRWWQWVLLGWRWTPHVKPSMETPR